MTKEQATALALRLQGMFDVEAEGREYPCDANGTFAQATEVEPGVWYVHVDITDVP
jgi:hypothetical protein